MRPRSPGFIKALAKAEMIDTGVLDASGSPVNELPSGVTKGNLIAADGTSYNALAVGTNDFHLVSDSTADAGVAWKAVGTSLPAGYDAEVSDGLGASLATALGLNDNIYVSASMNIATTITIVGNQRILFADGITITCDDLLTTTAAFSIPTGTSLSFDCPGSYTLLSEVSHSGGVFVSNTTGFLRATGKMFVDITAAATCLLSNNLSGYIEDAEITLGDLATYVLGGGTVANELRIDNLTIVGGGTSSRIDIDHVRVDFFQTIGTFKTFVVGSMSTTSAWKLELSSVGTFSKGDGGNSGLWLDTSNVVTIMHDSGNKLYVMPEQNSVVSSITGKGTIHAVIENEANVGNNVFSGGTFEGFDSQSGSDGYTFMGCGFSGILANVTLTDMEYCRFIGGQSIANITLDSTFDKNDFVGVKFGNALTITSGASNNKFTNCVFSSSLTLTSTSYSVFVNCTFEGTVTVDSGAKCVLISCIAGTITNNDSTNTTIAKCIDTSGVAHSANNEASAPYTTLKTVGPDASNDYATVKGAMDGGFYDILLTESITETTSVTTFPAQDVSVTFAHPNVVWTIDADVQFTSATFADKFIINLNGGTISYGQTTDSFTLFNFTIAGTMEAGLRVNGGGEILYTSTANYGYFAERGCTQIYSGSYTYRYTANCLLGGFALDQGNIDTLMYFDQLTVVGFSSSNRLVLLVNAADSRFYCGSLSMIGTWASGYTIIFIGTNSGGTAAGRSYIGTMTVNTASTTSVSFLATVVGSIWCEGAGVTTVIAGMGTHILGGDLTTSGKITISGTNLMVSDTKLDFDQITMATSDYFTLERCYPNTTDAITINVDFMRLIDCHSIGALTVSGNNNEIIRTECDAFVVSGDFNTISENRPSGVLTISGDSNIVTGNRPVGTTAIDGHDNTITANNSVAGMTTAGDRNTIVGCRVGVTGGALTITVASGSDENTITGCRTDAAISDSGTGTVTAGNVVVT